MSFATETALDTVRSTFDFEVKKFPLTGPDNTPTPVFGLFRGDTFEMVGGRSVSDRYTPHTTDAVLRLTEATKAVFEDGMNVECHFRDGHYVRVQPTVDIRKSIYGTADNIFKRVMIEALFDGSFRFSIGCFRDACENMVMLKSVASTSVAFRHTRGLTLQVNDLIATVAKLNDGWDNLVETIERMESKEVDLANFLNEIYPQPILDPRVEGYAKRTATIHTNRTKAIINRVIRERNATGRPRLLTGSRVSAWEAYNAVQGYVQHEATRALKDTSFDRAIKASRDTSVHHAEQLAIAA